MKHPFRRWRHIRASKMTIFKSHDSKWWKGKIKAILPTKVKTILCFLMRLFIYENYNSSLYWRSRAKEPGQKSVLWQNENFNRIFREKQKEIILPYIKDNLSILDIGCGTGYLAKMIVELNESVFVDGIDFEEMIEEAKIRNPHPRINYISSPAEEYFDENKKYDLIISSACFSMIRDVEKLKKAIRNVTLMSKKNTIILMIEPFHKWCFLARAKFSSKDVIKLMKSLGFRLTYKSGVLFWPFRVIYCNSNLSYDILKPKFEKSERLLHFLGSHLWADYKILEFRKDVCQNIKQNIKKEDSD